MPATYVIAWRSGLIEFSPTVPEGAIKVGRLGSGVRKTDVLALARHARTERGVLLVPGVPEANSDNDALDALVRFTTMLKERQVGRKKS